MTVALKCSQCGRVFELWPEPFHYWWTRGGTRLICQGTRWQATRAEPGRAGEVSVAIAFAIVSGFACFGLLVALLDERKMRNFWHEMWWRETRFINRMLDERGHIDPPAAKEAVESLMDRTVGKVRKP